MPGRARPSALLFVLSVAAQHAAAAPYDFRNNYKSSPAPVEGSHAAIKADSETARLPYDVSGVVGGYLLAVLIWGTLILTVGRRMRRKALEPPKSLELELQDKPIRPSLKTPLSPGSTRSATSWLNKFKKGSSIGSAPQSPAVQSPMSFDQKVIDANRDQAQADMERLYAAVMDHDAKKSMSQVSVAETEVTLPNATAERRRPSAISTVRPQKEDNSPLSPVRAIYPPDFRNSSQTDRLRDNAPPASPRSIVSKRSQASASGKNARFNLKNLRIAGPATRYPGQDSDDEATTPLSPRFQTGPPSPPTQPNSPASPYDPTEELDTVQPLPRPAPQRLGSMDNSTPLPARPGLSLPKSASSSTSTLPLRSFAEPLKSPGIQTTVLDRRVQQLSLKTPGTSVPFTPYSPYMPFTPITPVTPHLVTKRDRKMKIKTEGKHRQAREEMVQSPKEIFGDAW